MSIEKTSRRKPGRPRKYGQGRINATVRFTPERYDVLKQAADAAGRSVSEQVEAMVERAFALDELMAAMGIDDAKLADSVFRRTHTALHTSHGNIWIPKGHPDAPKTGGFIEPEEEKS
jgi:hypothetical protein